jgi:hypothetical protein
MTEQQLSSPPKTAGRAKPFKLLVAAVSVPPIPHAVAFVVDNLSRQFTKDELVIAGELRPGNVGHVRAADLPRFEFVSKSWEWPKRGQKYVRWLRWFQTPGIVRRLRKLIREEKIDAVLAIFPDERLMMAAMFACQREGVAFFPWYHNTYAENRRGLAKRFAEWLQPATFAATDIVFVMSEGMQTAWQRSYPGVRFEPLVHTFSDDLPTPEPLHPCHSPARTVFLGNLNASNLEAMGRMRELVNDSEDLRMTVYSGSSSWYFQKVGICGPHITHEHISDEDLMAGLKSHDILLLPHGFTGASDPIEYETIFPTRTIPYLLAGRPILAHTPPHAFLTRWLRRHDCAEIVDTADLNALRAAADRLRTDNARREQLVQNARKAAEMFHAPRVMNDFRVMVGECLARRAAAKGAPG